MLGLVSRVVPCLRADSAEVCVAIVDFAEVAVRNRPVACLGTKPLIAHDARARYYCHAPTVSVVVVDLIFDLYTRNLQLQCWMMRSFHLEQGLASNSPLSMLCLLFSQELVTMPAMDTASAILTEESLNSGAVAPPTGRGEGAYPL